VVEIPSESLHVLEENPGLVSGRGAAEDLRVLDREQVMERHQGLEAGLPIARGRRTTSSRSGPSAAFAIRRWKASTSKPSRSQRSKNREVPALGRFG
jgi:hypothetical protein